MNNNMGMKIIENHLKVGLLLSIQMINDQDNLTKHHKSRIADFKGDLIAIEVPISEEDGKMKSFAQDSEVAVSFIVEGGSRYGFESKVVERMNENIPLLLITMPQPDKIIKIQQRDYLRVPANLVLKLKTVESNQSVQVTTVDVSGGGIAFTADKSLSFAKGNELDCVIEVPRDRGENELLEFNATVIRVIPPTEERLVQVIAIKITEIQERNRDKIIRYCFKRQVELRKKLYL
ncbi:flagellar brake protein [Ammoniphilus resinae]|nr:flagellar brake domain-containing protein [Ammoniphilus resinae]